MNKIFCIVLLALVPVVGIAGSESPPVELPLATVNEEPILSGDLERHLTRMHDFVGQTDRAAFDADRLMFKLVNDTLIGQEARAAGMAEDPEIADSMADYRDELVREHLEKVEIRDRVEPKPEEVQRLFQEQYREIQLRVVTAYEQEEAERMAGELREGADMETMALERSVDPIKTRGGLMKPAPMIDLQREISELAAAMAVGEVGGPVRTDLGWTVFRVESRSDADPARFEKLEKQLRGILVNDKARVLRADLAKTAREHHEVVLDQALIDQLKPEPREDGRLSTTAPEPDRPVVRIGEHRTVRAGDYVRALNKRWKRVRNREAAVAAAPIILNALVERELLVAEGQRRGYGALPELRSKLRARETQLLVPRYLEEFVAADIEVTTEEMRAYYEENKNRFLQPPRVRLGQVTVATMEEAEKVAGMLRGGADLAWVVKQHSTDGYKEAGGLREWTTLKPGLDPLQDMLLDAAAGDVLDPFGAEGNFIVLKIVGREEQGPFAYDRISGNVRDALFKEKARVALDGYITTLRERSEIVVYEDRIRALAFAGSFSEQDEEGAPGGHGH